MSATRHFAVTLTRSLSGRDHSQRATLESLGLRRIGKTVYLKDTPAVRGMLYKVVQSISVTPQDGPPPLSTRQKRKAQKSGKKAAHA